MDHVDDDEHLRRVHDLETFTTQDRLREYVMLFLGATDPRDPVEEHRAKPSDLAVEVMMGLRLILTADPITTGWAPFAKSWDVVNTAFIPVISSLSIIQSLRLPV